MNPFSEEKKRKTKPNIDKPNIDTYTLLTVTIQTRFDLLHCCLHGDQKRNPDK